MSRIIIFIFSILLPLSAYSQNGDAVKQEFKTMLQTISNKNQTIQCTFNQNKKVKNITQIIQSNGLFYYDNSGVMAMHYTTPKGDKIIMDGDSFLIITSGKKISTDVTSNPIMAQISSMMQACMSGDISKLGRGWDMHVEKSNNGFKVLLRPVDRRIQKYITSMTMWFRDSDLTLDALRIDEKTGGYTEYTFTNKVINDKIDRSFFTVK